MITALIKTFPLANAQSRDGVLYDLFEVNSAEADDFLVTVLKSDTSHSSRFSAFSYLAGRPTSAYEAYVFQAAATESDKVLRMRFCNYVHYRDTPYALQRLRELLVTEPDQDIRWRLDFQITTYKPRVPDIKIPVITLLDTLISTKHQVAALGWLRDKKEDEKDEEDEEKEDGIVKKLDKRLEKARAVLVKRDSSKTRQEIEKFIKKVEKLRKESIGAEQKGKPEKIVLSEEGYRFLYYNAKYILDRLPDRKPNKGSKDKD